MYFRNFLSFLSPSKRPISPEFAKNLIVICTSIIPSEHSIFELFYPSTGIVTLTKRDVVFAVLIFISVL